MVLVSSRVVLTFFGTDGVRFRRRFGVAVGNSYFTKKNFA
jgi:hypothetical protein